MKLDKILNTINNLPEKKGLSRLKKIEKMVDDNLLKMYHKIYQQCFEKISIAQSNFENQTIFNVPLTLKVKGYNLSECVFYLLQILKKDGFSISYAKPNTLIVTWICSDYTNDRDYIESFLEEEDYKSRELTEGKNIEESIEDILRNIEKTDESSEEEEIFENRIVLRKK